MNPFGLFFRLFHKAGWPPPSVFVQGLVPVLVWHVLGAFFPEASEEVRLSWAVLAYLTAILWMRCRYGIEVAKQGRLNPVSIARHFFGYWVVLAAFVYLSQELAWAQHWITGVLAFQAVAYLTEIVFKSELLGTLTWSDEELANARPVFMVTSMLLYAGLALMNETLVAQVSLKAWMIWIAILPLLIWLLVRALRLTVLMSLDDAD